jgi:hypothetical protein
MMMAYFVSQNDLPNNSVQTYNGKMVNGMEHAKRNQKSQRWWYGERWASKINRQNPISLGKKLLAAQKLIYK